MSRATEEALDLLHGATAEAFAEEIRKYREGVYTDGDGNPLPIPASLLANAGKFLKDNGVDRPGKPDDPVDRLAAELPDLDDVMEGARH